MESYTRCARGAHTVRARCVYSGDFIDLPTYLTVKCMCLQAVKCITMHTALCPFTVSPMSLSWLLAGITVTCSRSNGDRVPPPTIISASAMHTKLNSALATHQLPLASLPVKSRK